MSDAPVADAVPAEPTEPVEPTEPPSGEGEPEPAPPAEPGEDEPQDLKDLRAKYPGEDDAKLLRRLAPSYWEQTREISRLHKERSDSTVEELRNRVKELEARTAPPADKNEPPPPEIQRLEQEITSLTQERDGLYQQQAAALQQLTETNVKIERLKGQVESPHTPEDEKPHIQRSIDALEARYAAIYAQWQSSGLDAKRTQRELSHLVNERDWTKQVVTERAARQKQEQEQAQTDLKAVVADVDAQIAKTVTDLKFGDLADDAKEYIFTKVTNDFRKLGNTPVGDIDVEGLVRQHAEKYAKISRLEARRDFAKRSENKAAVSGRPGAPAPRSAPPKPPLDQMARARKALEAKGW